MWEAKVADLAAKVAMLKYNLREADAWCEKDWATIDEMDSEIRDLRRLAWEGWERAVEAEDWQRAMRQRLRCVFVGGARWRGYPDENEPTTL